MFLAVLSTLAGADEPPSPSREGSVGFGIYQVAAASHTGTRAWPRVNVHALYGGPIGARGWRAGVHAAVQRVPYGPRNEGRASLTARLEPRIGYRVGHDQPVSIEFMLGGAVDVDETVRFGPVLSMAPRVRIGRNLRSFVYLEGRVAPLFWGYSYSIACHSYCDNERVFNPGGSGLIVGIGRVMDP